VRQREWDNRIFLLWTLCGRAGDDDGNSCGRQVHKPVHERGDNVDTNSLTRGIRSTSLWRKNKSGGKRCRDQIADAVIEISGQLVKGKPAQVIGLRADDLLRIRGD